VREGKDAEVGGLLAGGVASAGLSAGAIGAAGRLGGPGTARATSVAIQPGEEAAIAAARSGVVSPSTASLVPGVRQNQFDFGSGPSGPEIRASEFQVKDDPGFSFGHSDRGQLSLTGPRSPERRRRRRERPGRDRPSVEDVEIGMDFDELTAGAGRRLSEAEAQSVEVQGGLTRGFGDPRLSEVGAFAGGESAVEETLGRLEDAQKQSVEPGVDTLGGEFDQRQRFETGLDTRQEVALDQRQELDTGLDTRQEVGLRQEQRLEFGTELRQEQRFEFGFETGLESEPVNVDLDIGRRDDDPFGFTADAEEREFINPIGTVSDIIGI
jgi:hypothetical protein